MSELKCKICQSNYVFKNESSLEKHIVKYHNRAKLRGMYFTQDEEFQKAMQETVKSNIKLKSDLDKLQKENQKLEVSLEENKEFLKKMINQSFDQKQILHKEIKNLKRKFVEKQKENEENKIERNALLRKISTLETEIEHLQEKIK